jgi:hypothetical protein
MIDSLSEFEKQLIYSAFYKEVNMAPREIENLVGIVEAPPQPDASATAAAPPRAAGSRPPPPPPPPAAPLTRAQSARMLTEWVTKLGN